MPGNLVCLALKEERDSWVDLEVVKVARWDPVVGSRSWTGVGLEELHSLIELELGEVRNLLGVGWVGQSLLVVAPLLVVAGLDSWADSLQVELEVELEVEVGNWAPPILEELCSQLHPRLEERCS